MELSTTTRGKAKLLWNGYTKHTEKNDMIRWHCTCRASKHCPASAYTDLLPAYPVLKTYHNPCPEKCVHVLQQVTTRQLVFTLTTSQHWQVQLRRFYRVSIRVIFFKEICLYRIFIGFYQNAMLPKCMLPKCLLPKYPITETSYYRNVLLPKCQLPKRPLPKCPLPKCLDTIWVIYD